MGAAISQADVEGMKHNGYDPVARMEDRNDSRPYGPQYAVALQELRTAIAEAERRIDHLMGTPGLTSASPRRTGGAARL